MPRTRVKFCGITRTEDALAAADAGADAIGLVFYPRSARSIDARTAARICAALPPFVTAVGLFLDPSDESVREVISAVPLGMLQFHGDESAAFCRSFGRPYLKSVAMAAQSAQWSEKAQAYGDAQAVLVDSHAPGEAGGTGQPFDWTRIPERRGVRIVLAGGLRADNVAEAIERIGPDAVDVSSGVESSKGIKDERSMIRFIEEVQRGDAHRG